MSKLTPLLLLVMVYQVLNSGDLQECFKKKVSCKKDFNCKQECQDKGFEKGKCRKQNLADCPVDQPWGCMCDGKTYESATDGDNNGDGQEAIGVKMENGTKQNTKDAGTCYSCCQTLDLTTSNPETRNAQDSKLGKYVKAGFCLNNFPVYKQESGSSSLFRMVGPQQWIVGQNTVGRHIGGIFASDQSDCPEDLTGWKYHNGNSWLLDGTFRATCTGSCNCGLAKRKTRIVGGQETEVHEYPWQVGMVNWGASEVWCGGSLISDQWIMTAAHCVFFKSPGGIQVLLGEHDYTSSSESSMDSVRANIEKKIIHPQYDTGTNTNYDFALLKMTSTINFLEHPHIRPICLPEDDSQTYSGMTATVTGWGRTSFGGSLSSSLQEVDVNVLSNSQCQNDYEYGSSQITDQMLCASVPSGGKDACHGDSGGPLVTSGTGDGVTAGQNYEQIGVVSWGYGCAKATAPGVYARVTAQIPWVIENAKPFGTTCPRTN